MFSEPIGKNTHQSRIPSEMQCGLTKRDIIPLVGESILGLMVVGFLLYAGHLHGYGVAELVGGGIALTAVVANVVGLTAVLMIQCKRDNKDCNCN